MLFQAPVGKRIEFNFTHLDTQTNVDFVHFYDGSTSIPENEFARFSGNAKKRPVVTSRTNEVLVWFLTDGNSTSQGWEFRYTIVD